MYKRLAFGLSGGPSSFMKLLDSVLAEVDDIFIYLDDILVHSPDEESHFKKLEEIFSKCLRERLQNSCKDI